MLALNKDFQQLGSESEHLPYAENLKVAVTRLNPVRISCRDVVLNIAFRFLRKHRGHRSIQRLADFYTG